MRKLAIIFVAMLCIGCGQPAKLFVEALDASWKDIRPYAEAGVAKDETLDQDQKANRMALIEEFGKTIEEAKANAR